MGRRRSKSRTGQRYRFRKRSRRSKDRAGLGELLFCIFLGVCLSGYLFVESTLDFVNAPQRLVTDSGSSLTQTVVAKIDSVSNGTISHDSIERKIQANRGKIRRSVEHFLKTGSLSSEASQFLRNNRKELAKRGITESSVVGELQKIK
ncbi:MAG: hypothetical protein KDD53_02230, partial [Bdellovibrionales bacterium]|nr:hypothetical protein [Bdellovibrionales bacterium]